MDGVQSNEEFEHFHADGIKNIRLEEARLAEARLREDLGVLDDALQKTMKGSRGKLSGDLASSPERIFKTAFNLLKEADRNRFLIENALESLKQGKTYANIVQRYIDMGFLPDRTTGDKTTPDKAPLHGTIALVERKSIWERYTTFIMQVGVNALKSVPKWIEIEPHVTIGPVPSISFTLKGKGLSLHEFFEALAGSEEAAWAAGFQTLYGEQVIDNPSKPG